MSAHAVAIERCSRSVGDALEDMDLVKRSVHTLLSFTIGAAFQLGRGIRPLRRTFALLHQ
jgi:hypothetical protein